MRVSIWVTVVLDKILARSFLMKSRLVGQRSEAEVWPRPCSMQVGMHEGWWVVWAVDRQVGQTGIFEQDG